MKEHYARRSAKRAGWCVYQRIDNLCDRFHAGPFSEQAAAESEAERLNRVKTCKTCRHWVAAESGFNPIERDICSPVDPDTFEPMLMPFEVRRCAHPEKTFHERPVSRDGFGLADASEYMAELYTGEDFGCVRHESATV